MQAEKPVYFISTGSLFFQILLDLPLRLAKYCLYLISLPFLCEQDQANTKDSKNATTNNVPHKKQTKLTVFTGVMLPPLLHKTLLMELFLNTSTAHTSFRENEQTRCDDEN